MSDEAPLVPDDDTAPPVDPFEAELVAYLDGELDEAAARKVEARLAADPAARARAAALKKTFDLLDYLPRPDPSPSFTTKTLDKLPAVKSAEARSAPARTPALESSSAPVPLATTPLPLPEDPRHSRRALWAAGVLVAVGACALGGYLVSAALRPPHQSAQGMPDELPISDRGVIENLPLYAGADDLDFVHALADPELFGEDPAVAYDAKFRAAQSVPAARPSAAAFEKLAESFRALPPARQGAVRELHRQLNDVADRDERDRLFRVLEVYAIWLDRLPPTERKGVLAAATGAHRLDEIRAARERQWLDSLPQAQRDKIRGLPPADKAELIGQWRRAEAEHRDEWDFVREHADDIAANRVPWPFDDPARRKEVVEFVRVTFHTDRPAESRLTANEFDRLAQQFREAGEKQGWAWHAYGKTAYELTRKYELWFLPEPAAGEPVTRPEQLPKGYEKYMKGLQAKVAQAQAGKWPDFALAVHAQAQFPKGAEPRLPALGPAKPAEFREPLRSFVSRDLARVLGPQERRSLDMLEGRWPEYPREVARLARLHNLSAPGMMLPGLPRQWDTWYGVKSGPGRKIPGRP